MPPFRRKAVENALVAVLRELGGNVPVLKEARRLVGDRTAGCSVTELAAAVQALRYQGKLDWDRLELTPSMLIGSARARAWPDEDDGAEDEVPGEVNDEAECGPAPAVATPPPAVGFVPKPTLHKSGVHGAASRAAARPLPVPQHEPELARQIREEVEETRARRRMANSTATVRQPLEVRKLAIADLSVGETIFCMLGAEPRDVIRAVSRKHPQLWRRIILLSREREERPALLLYAALEAGLDALEPETATDRKAAA